MRILSKTLLQGNLRRLMPRVIPIAKNNVSRGNEMKKLFLAAVFVMLSIVAPAQSTWGRVLSGVVKAGQAASITDEQLAEVVGESVKEMDRQHKVCSATNAYTKRLNRLTKNMTDAEGIKLNFKVYQTTELNAFACPDGSVRVFSALMDALTDNELLGVIGHEIGHVALRHSKKAWRSALLRSAASDALGAMSDTWAALSDSFLGDISSAALSAKHSRYHENQADDFGFDFLKKCGKNPKAMIQMLQKLKEMTASKSTKYDKFLQAFSSHPDFNERISRMEKRGK